jgi:hypothetical protein
MFGTAWAFGVFGVRGVVEVSERMEDGRLGSWDCEAIRLIASGMATGRGGGNGDIEMLVMDA